MKYSEYKHFRQHFSSIDYKRYRSNTEETNLIQLWSSAKKSNTPRTLISGAFIWPHNEQFMWGNFAGALDAIGFLKSPMERVMEELNG